MERIAALLGIKMKEPFYLYDIPNEVMVKNKYALEEGGVYIIKDNGSKNYASNMIEEIFKGNFKIVKPVKITFAEKIILENIDPEFKYIARDCNNSLYVYSNKPWKGERVWFYNGKAAYLNVFDHLFKFIRHEDNEPYYIPDILKYAR